ncbi:ASCH domain-containing protein [Salinicoccus sp. RF5]|uniref:ASCH domain-containing protein n=1 Tax=Salinicoccus sp. RF5 TaxID=2748874 RepID=UPI001E4C79FD|nr:ASCH domain-containing protein [Salinicoccus sp. RF5]MCC4721862.1 ASCH domain-containing protein [Salinicoccus sp. RF5]
MEHSMGLYEAPFNSMKAGRKTVEVRLNDPKRRKIDIKDTIRFTKLPEDGETLTVEVTALRTYPTFKDMYRDIPAKDMDADNRTIEEMVESTYEIYTRQQETEWGTLAIEIRLLK